MKISWREMLTLLLALGAAVPDIALAIPPTDAGRQVADHLSAEIDEPIRIRTSTLTAAELLGIPPLPWRERYLLFADPTGGRIILIRPEDRTLLLRGFDPRMTDSQAMAVVAAELLRLARSTVETPRPVAPVIVHAGDNLDLGVAVALGLAVTEAFGHEPVFFQPTIQVGAELIDRSSSLWSTAILAFKVPQVRERSFGETTIRYRRLEPSLLLGVGVLAGDFTVGATVEIGASITRAEALAPSGDLIRREDRLPFSISGGGLVRYQFGAGFGLQLAASLGASTSPADYLVKDEVALSEGPLRWQATVAGVWGYR